MTALRRISDAEARQPASRKRKLPIHDLAKIGVEGSNLFARSNFPLGKTERYDRATVRWTFAFRAYISRRKKVSNR